MKKKVGWGKFAVKGAAVLLCLLVLGFFVSLKEGFHMDELLSFELANAEYNPWIVPTQPEGRLARFVHREIRGESPAETFDNLLRELRDVLENGRGSKLLTYRAEVYEEPVWITGQQFRDYITVEKEDAFQYLSVYFNVKDDNHPPLHFMLLHTVSSIFRGKAEPWMGCIINLAAVAGILLLLMKTAELAADMLGFGGYAGAAGLCCALVYGLSAGAVATVLLIRMYALVTLWCVALLYLVLKSWREDSFRRGGMLVLVTVLGFWTQYFFLFYCILLAGTVAVLLAIRRKWGQLRCFVRSMLIAAAVGLIGFPFAISDVLSSGRGVEALENLSRGLDGYGGRLLSFLDILGKEGPGAGLWVLCGLCLLAALTAGVKDRLAVRQEQIGQQEQTEQQRRSRAECLALLMIPVAGYFLLAARMSPYLVDRYVMPLFPFLALAAVLLLFYCMNRLMERLSGQGGVWSPEKKKTAAAAAVCILAAALQLPGLLGYDGSYLYRGYRAQEEMAEEYGSLPCLCVYEGVGYYENLKEFACYSKTLLLKPGELENRQDRESLEEPEGLVLLLKSSVNREQVLELLEREYGLTVEKQLLDGESSVHGDELYVLKKTGAGGRDGIAGR